MSLNNVNTVPILTVSSLPTPSKQINKQDAGAKLAALPAEVTLEPEPHTRSPLENTSF